MNISSLILTLAAQALVAWQAEAPGNSPTAETIFVAIRTSDHMKRSSIDKFDQAVDGVEAYLRNHEVALREDPLRKQVRIEGEVRRDALTRIARDAGADQVLELVVNRPRMSWMELTLRCWTLGGQALWEVRAAASSQITSKDHVQKSISGLTKKLDPRLNGPCLSK